MSKLLTILNLLNIVSETGIAIALLFGLSALVVQRLRSPFATYLYALSCSIGAATWLFSAITLYGHWGFIGLLIGLFIAGIGVVPVAMISMMVHGEWIMLLTVAVQLVMLFGCRFGSLVLLQREGRRNQHAAEVAFDDLNDGV